MKNHTQDLLVGEAVTITLNNGITLREVIKGADLIGIIIDTTVTARDGGMGSVRVIPWGAIQDIAILQVPSSHLRDHRYASSSLNGGEGILPMDAVHDVDGVECHVCRQLNKAVK